MLIRYGDSSQLQPLQLACNTEDEGLFSNVEAACKLGLPEVMEIKVRMPQVVICGGGPSLADTLEKVRELKSEGAFVFALNNAAQFLVKNGIRPDAQVIVDPRPDNTKFIQEIWADTLYLCSQCSPEMFDQAKAIGYPVKLFHHAAEKTKEYLPNPETACVIGGGYTVGLSTLCMAYALGWRQMHLFGYDSSHASGTSHAYSQPMNADDEIVQCCVDSRVFDCSLAMAGQAAEFKATADMLEACGCTFAVYGEGLIPTMWRADERLRKQKVLTAVYDLGCSPPTYDFLSFLIEAERHRIAEKFDLIDIAFQPGPMHGFRNDELPPDVATRRGMLWGVCVAMARLLPSVRNVSVWTQRMEVSGDVFPVEYAENQPKSHYGTTYLKGGSPMLRASENARRHVAMRFSKPYATISLRETPWWPDRNSNKAEWTKVAFWLRKNGIQPIIIPDTQGLGLDGDFEEFTPASFDLDLRCALYEGAVINLGVLNGPMSLLAYLKARYLIVKVNVESAVATTTEFLRSHGYESGDDFGGNGKMIWKSDEAETIIAELQEFAVKQTEKTS